MISSKLKYSLPLALLLASSLSFSIVPAAVLAWLASGTIGLSAGSLLWYALHDTRPALNQQPVRVYYDVKEGDDVPVHELPAPPNFTPPPIPQQNTRSVNGGQVTVTVAPHTNSGTTYEGGTFQGHPDEVTNSLRYAPSPPHRYATTTTGATPQGISQLLAASANNSVRVSLHHGTFSPTHPAHPCFVDAGGVCRQLSQATSFNTNIPVTSTHTPSQTGFYAKVLIISSNGNVSQILQPLQDANFVPCPFGYSVNAQDPSKCDLTNIQEASSDENTVRDGKCLVNKNGQLKNPQDADCLALETAGGLWRDTAGVLHSKDPTGSLSTDTVAVRPRADGGTDISLSNKNADGSGSLTDLEITLDGILKKVNRWNTAPPYIPTYPGAPTGSGSPSGYPSTSTGNTGSTCGGPDQPACKMSAGEGFWDGLKDALGLGGDGDGDGSGGGSGDSDLPGQDPLGCTDCQANTQKKEGFLDTLLAFNEFDLQLQTPSCHAAFSGFDKTISWGSESIDLSISPACDLLENEESLIKSLFLIGWTLLALFVLLSKVK